MIRLSKGNRITRAYLVRRLLLDLLYPNRCPLCNEIIPFDEYFCKVCGKKLSKPPGNTVSDNLDGFAAVTVYDSVSIPYVGEMKRRNNGYALSGAAYKIYERLLETDILDKTDAVTYVPMANKDLYKRGYNQTKVIAKEVAGLSGIPCAGLLKKVKETFEQKKLGAEDRRKNVVGAFNACNNRKLIGKNILVIDDVSTTGSTLSEAARALKAGGAEKVFAAVFAKTKLG